MFLSDCRLLCNEVFVPSIGVLCGGCRDGLGVSALLNKCVTCSDSNGLLIVILSE